MKKILVVEDDPVNQMILMDFLAANGYATVAASTGPEGIERFKSDAPDLCLVDVQLPQEELRLLEMVRDRLEVDRLVTAAIEASARARMRKA